MPVIFPNGGAMSMLASWMTIMKWSGKLTL